MRGQQVNRPKFELRSQPVILDEEISRNVSRLLVNPAAMTQKQGPVGQEDRTTRNHSVRDPPEGNRRT